MAAQQSTEILSDGSSASNETGKGPVHGRARQGLGFKPITLPVEAWSRLTVLFVALALIKVGLLLALGKHLCEVHWRVGSTDPGWGDYISFGVFVCLGVMSLGELGRYCRSVGIKAVRAANATVIGLGLLFIFLTFHVIDKNYIYPIMAKTLKWGSLGPYLSLDLFFRAPFLGAWLFGYGFTYYVLARTGRESWMPYITAICTGVIALLNLRDLAVYRNELLIANGLGMLAVWRGRQPGRKAGIIWVLAPVAWSLLFAVDLFRLASVRLDLSMTYFLLLLATSAILFGGGTLLAQKKGYLEAWGGQVLFYFASFLLLTNANYPAATNFNHTLCLGAEFPHYFLGEVVVVGALAVCAMIWHRLWPRGSWWWLDGVNLAMIAVTFVDLRLTQIMGVRLEWSVLTMADKPRMMWRMSKPYLPGALAALALAALGYAGVLWVIGRWQRQREVGRGTEPAGNGLWYAGATAILLGLLGLVMADPDKAEGQTGIKLAQTSPLWKRMTKRTLTRERFLTSAHALGLGDFTAGQGTAPTRPRRDLNVMLVFMESSYNQHLSLFGSSEETEPLLSKYRDRMELFPNFFSNFAGSIHARFAAFTSLYPVRDFHAFTMERVEVKSVFEVMHDNGYTCSLFYSSYFDYTGFGDFLRQRGLDEMYDADTMPGQRTTERVSWGLREEETLGAIRGQIQKYARGGQQFFLTYVPAAPHYPFEKVPPAFHKHGPGEMGDYTPFYLNELLYMDWVLASILDELKANGLLEKTLVVITDDHGEMLGANGGPIGHGWLLSPELVNAPLIIMDPENPGCRVNDTIGSQVDLLPTLADRLGIALPGGQLYEGRSMDAPDGGAGDRLAYLNSMQQYGIVEGRQIVFGDRLKDEGRGGASSRTAFSIADKGSKTVFEPTGLAATSRISIQKFDDFQENLIANYSFYCESVLGGAKALSGREARVGEVGQVGMPIARH